MSIMPLASITSSFTGAGAAASARMILSLMYWAFVKVSGAAVAKTRTPGSCSRFSCRPGGPPEGGFRHARLFHAIGSHDEVQAVHEGQHDRQQHAGFDR